MMRDEPRTSRGRLQDDEGRAEDEPRATTG